jgi:hypothetical protein
MACVRLRRVTAAAANIGHGVYIRILFYIPVLYLMAIVRLRRKTTAAARHISWGGVCVCTCLCVCVRVCTCKPHIMHSAGISGPAGDSDM